MAVLSNRLSGNNLEMAAISLFGGVESLYLDAVRIGTVLVVLCNPEYGDSDRGRKL